LPGPGQSFQVSQTEGQGYALSLFESQDHPVGDPHKLACLPHGQPGLFTQVSKLEADSLGSILWRSIDESDLWIQKKLHLDLLLMLRFQHMCWGGYDRQRSQVCLTDSTAQMVMPRTEAGQWVAALMASRLQQTLMGEANLHRLQAPQQAHVGQLLQAQRANLQLEIHHAVEKVERACAIGPNHLWWNTKLLDPRSHRQPAQRRQWELSA
jgi:hypothetical protein